MMYKILLIEDERSMRLGLTHSLKAAGYNVIATDNGTKGIELAAQQYFDLVVTDVRLPDIDGLEVLRRVKNFSPDTGIVIITAFAEVKTAVSAIKDGAYDYLAKPFDPEELQMIIARFLRQRELESENFRLKEELQQYRFSEKIIAATPVMEALFEKISVVARTDSAVLIHGESGTGKELVVNAIHDLSARRDKPLVKINCAAIPEALLESELFGHEKGAFTGALQRRMGKFEAAHGGTLFLDEIGDMPLALQAKLLRVIENLSFERLGSNESVQVDIRTIYATAKNLEQEKDANRFRADLYYRLNVLPITLPPLRKRRDDIPLLVRHFLAKTAEKNGTAKVTVSPAAMRLLMSYEFPGNIRELKHAIEMAATFCKDGAVEPGDLPEAMVRTTETERKGSGLAAGIGALEDSLPLPEKIKAVEKELIAQALEEMSGVKKEAAKRLGVSRGTLWRKLKEHDFPCADDISDD
jgi:DNA-binding NtrC family response regulator